MKTASYSSRVARKDDDRHQDVHVYPPEPAPRRSPPPCGQVRRESIRAMNGFSPHRPKTEGRGADSRPPPPRPTALGLRLRWQRRSYVRAGPRSALAQRWARSRPALLNAIQAQNPCSKDRNTRESSAFASTATADADAAQSFGLVPLVSATPIASQQSRPQTRDIEGQAATEKMKPPLQKQAAAPFELAHWQS